MRLLRILSLVTCALTVVGCRDAALSEAATELRVTPSRLDFGRTWVGFDATRGLEVVNAGRLPLEVTLSTTSDFTTTDTLSLGGGEARTLDVHFLAAHAGTTLGTLSLTWGEQTLEVPLEGLGQTPPECPVRDCRRFTFDAERGACVEQVLDDGAACGAQNACISGGQCVHGECVGVARDCDDGDACTSDGCDATSGCVHPAVSCLAPTEPCLVAVCDAVTGCGTAPAVDGASCGANDCQTAHVCIAGQCVTRPAPDGSRCADATSCRGPGVCRAQQCELPTPTPLQPTWRYTPPADHVLHFLGHVDAQGNVYATESWVGTPMARAPGSAERDAAGVAISPPANVPLTAIVSLTRDGALRYRVQVTQDCASCTFGHFFAIDSQARRLFFTAQGETQARDLDTGLLLWRALPTNGLPAFNLKSDGGAAFSVSPPMLVGNDVVAIPVLEGVDDHHSYVQAFDRASGQPRWQFHRKGHLYGTGITSAGELWTSSANCWAVAGEMASVTSTGVTSLTKFVEWIPSMYGDGFAVGTAQGQLRWLDAAFDLHDLSWTGAGPASSAMVSDGALVLWDPVGQRLSAHDLDGGTAFTFRGVKGVGPVFELTAGGGAAWTSQTIDGGWVGAVDSHGQELVQCPLSAPVESATAISHGRAFMQSGSDLVAYDVGGLEVAPGGWVTRFGSLGRGGPTR